MKVNKGRKYTVLQDELGFKGGGLYAIMPFDKLDTHGKAMFKVGMAEKFKGRIDGYHTEFPQGFYIVAMLENPTGYRKVRNIKTNAIDSIGSVSYYRRIENYVFDRLADSKAKRITSTTRVRGAGADGKGHTEWFYTDADAIHSAFEDAHAKYGGRVEYYHLDDVNANYEKIVKRKRKYIGEIVYFV